MKFQFNDGGRQEAEYKGKTGDCVCRAISIVAQLPYQQVYDYLADHNATEYKTKHRRSSGQRTARKGIHVRSKWFKEYMKSLGFSWTPCMTIGSGCKVHLRDGELPMGRLIAAVSRHYTSIIDGVINDTYDPSRNGNRCVYGYWKLETN